ncbi:MAG: hypothetical protein ACI85U_001585, partial [Candidatus Promineifilaceae bacterium]
SQDQIAFEALQLVAESITSDLDFKNVLINLGEQINRLIGCDAWAISDYIVSTNALVTLVSVGPEAWFYSGEGVETFYLDANPTTAFSGSMSSLKQSSSNFDWLNPSPISSDNADH